MSTLTRTAARTSPPVDRRRPTAAASAGRWAVFALVALATAVVLLPIVVIVLTAFKPVAEVNAYPPTLWPREWTLGNFRTIFEELPFARLILNSFVFAGGVTACALVFDSLAAYALARLDFTGSRLLLVLVVASLMIPFQATLVPIYQLLGDLGWVDTYAALIVPRAADAFGIFFLRQFFLALPRDLDNAARIDGASEWRVYRSVVLPNAVPALLTLGVFVFVNNWNDLLWPLVFSTGEDSGTITSGLTLLTGPSGIVPYGVMMAGSLIALVPLVVLFALVQRRFVASVATSGLK